MVWGFGVGALVALGLSRRALLSLAASTGALFFLAAPAGAFAFLAIVKPPYSWSHSSSGHHGEDEIATRSRDSSTSLPYRVVKNPTL
jgi:hypothetical protein